MFVLTKRVSTNKVPCYGTHHPMGAQTLGTWLELGKIQVPLALALSLAGQAKQLTTTHAQLATTTASNYKLARVIVAMTERSHESLYCRFVVV